MACDVAAIDLMRVLNDREWVGELCDECSFHGEPSVEFGERISLASTWSSLDVVSSGPLSPRSLHFIVRLVTDIAQGHRSLPPPPFSTSGCR